MASYTEHPIIMPLSNPTSLAEATPIDIYKWTEGKALVAAGSPFKPVTYDGKMHSIAQCNNAYIFPGLGMGIMAAKASRLTEAMLLAACHALSRAWFELKDDHDLRLLPPIDGQYHDFSMRIAKAVMITAISDGVSTYTVDDIDERFADLYWYPEYYRFFSQ
jgi:malate dehydrogenase (oxaloacetate-decarboxylating)